MSYSSTKALREQARSLGYATFSHDEPCTRCGTYLCKVSVPKGRGCVQCAALAQRKHNQIHEAIRKASKREWKANNRPSHNPEKVLFDAIRRSGVLEPHLTDKEGYAAFGDKLSLLKKANGDYPNYTADHTYPVTGFVVNGQTYYGRSSAENIRIMSIEQNKIKSNSVSDTTPPAAMAMHESKVSTLVSKDISTEELRSLFYRHCGVNTKPNNTYQAGEKDTDEDTVKYKKQPLTEKEAMRAATVLEILMSGHPELLNPSEKNPLPFFWCEEKKQMVQAAIRVNKDLHNTETLSNASGALHWLDKAIHQISLANSAQADWCVNFVTKSPFPQLFTEKGMIDRVERHFIEWVLSWFNDITQSKPIYDFLPLVDEDLCNQWFKHWKTEADLRAAVTVAKQDVQKYQVFVNAGSEYGKEGLSDAERRLSKAETALNRFTTESKN